MIISKTPMRISFFGGGTDFRNYFENSRFGYGEVLSTAISMSVYITVSKKFDDQIRVCYSQNEIVNSVDELRHNIIREALRMTGIRSGVEILYMADLPLGTAGVGMASSSAIAVGTLNALLAYKGVFASPETLARMACELEIERLYNPIGIQDQYAVAFGGFRHYRFYGDGRVTNEPVLLSPESLAKLKSSLMLFFTGLTRDSAPIMREQTDNISNKMELLDSLVEETDKANQAIREGRVESWGYALDRCWNIKRSLANGISNPEIDCIYETAKNAGALGGKILGAGGGGFLLLFVPEERQASVSKALHQYRRVGFDFAHSGSQIIFVD